MKKTPLIVLVTILPVLFGLSVRPHAVSALDPQPPAPLQRAQLPRFPDDAGAQHRAPPVPPSPLIADNVRLPWSQVVYQWLHGDGHDDFNIFIANDDGSATRVLTDEPGHEVEPELSRGGGHIVYSAAAAGQPYNIYVMNADGSGKTLLANGGNNRNPSWSPDGTKIVFESDRNGQSDLYIMNADGTGLRALAAHAAFDAMPTWSPDGARIAFSSTRSGAYRIWVVNTDGSGLQMLSSIPYSVYPSWSPDGKKLAFSASADNVWLDIYTVDADGSNEQLFVPGYGDMRDFLAASWSPDGSHLLYTEVWYVLYEGQWYWTHSELLITNGLHTEGLFGNSPNNQWHPSWVTTDKTPPTIALPALGATMPYRFAVRWAGVDGGGAGLRDYEVQTRIGSVGSWTTWHEATPATEEQYSGGSGGQHLEFRARARDRAFNVGPWSSIASTSIEDQAPVVQMAPLPLFRRDDEPLAVAWYGSDPGASGIAHYDLQMQIDGGAWTGWQTAITETHAILTDTVPGAQVGFRVRATDRAGNVMPWPAAPAGHTTFYHWAVQGTVYDNGGAAISGAQPSAPQASAVESQPSRYAAYFDAGLDAAALGWQHAEYGQLPATTFHAGLDTYHDAIMPPRHNLVTDWGFESGDWGNGWQNGGALPAAVSDVAPHSGQYAAILGRQDPPPPVQSLLGDHESYAYKFEIDARGVGHLLVRRWQGTQHLLYYMQLQADHTWSPPEVVDAQVSSETWARMFMSVTAGGEVHVFWQEDPQSSVIVRYRVRDLAGNWTAPETAATAGFYNHQMLVAVDDVRDIVHLVFTDLRSGDDNQIRAYYTFRDVAGWAPAQMIATGEYTNSELSPNGLALGADGSLHLVSTEFSIWYRRRTPGGFWQAPVQLAQPFQGAIPSLALGPNGKIHALWLQEYYGYQQQPATLWYAVRDAAGLWSRPTAINEQVPPYAATMVVGADGVVHVAWSGWRQGLYYTWRDEHAGWRYPRNYRDGVAFDGEFGGVQSFALDVDAGGTAHLAWAEVADSNTWQWRVFRAHRRPGEQLQQELLWQGSQDPLSISASLAMGALDHDNVVLLWEVGETAPLYAHIPSVATVSSTASISTTVTIPSAMENPLLSFLYDLSGMGGGESFRVSVVDGAQETVVFHTAQAAGWQHARADLSPWIGRTVTLDVTLQEVAGTLQSVAIVDEVTVGRAYPDTWVTLTAVGHARNGRRTVYDVAFGNQGAVGVGASKLTLTLPSAITFLEASQSPLINGNTLTWDIDPLAAHSAPQRITVTGLITPDLQTGSLLLATAVLTSPSPELETANNAAIFNRVVVPHDFWLPVLSRQVGQ